MHFGPALQGGMLNNRNNITGQERALWTPTLHFQWVGCFFFPSSSTRQNSISTPALHNRNHAACSRYDPCFVTEPRRHFRLFCSRHSLGTRFADYMPQETQRGEQSCTWSNASTATQSRKEAHTSSAQTCTPSSDKFPDRFPAPKPVRSTRIKQSRGLLGPWYDGSSSCETRRWLSGPVHVSGGY